MDATRVDQWLWAIRLCTTRSQATTACKGGHVRVNGRTAKAATPVVVGDRVQVYVHRTHRDVEVVRLIQKRVGATVAVGCYVDHTPPPPPDTERSAARIGERERGAGRPTKRDRRQMDRLRDRNR